ncbi:ATP-binding protein [Luteimicrobium sp. NPDC057192]|uniref:ATP-binding protein n=1 Tax=Luteimicrobium sp. NPDC057192 TaxID=3346042 RepID=UPI003637E10D
MGTGPVPGRSGASGTSSLPGDLASLDRAVAALEQQRAVLGDAVVDAALAPLRAHRLRLGASASGEQRKVVTVLFADLVDFTATSAALDPEDVRGLVHRYFARWRACVEAEGGTVEKFIGDAVMAVFGLGRSAEDDAERAVRAALAMRTELASLDGAGSPTRTGSPDDAAPAPVLRMRVGLDTGEVVVGTLGERGLDDLVVVGDTVNRAARLQTAAPPDGVLVSAATRRHVRGVFVLEPRPGLVLKGFADPVDAFLVLTARPRAFRLDAARGIEGVVTPTVGRDAELSALHRHVEEVGAGAGWRLVAVVGDAGVGKTRLLRELDTWLGERTDDVWWFRGRAWASSRHRAGALLRDVLATRLGIRESDPSDAARDAVRAGLAAVPPADGDAPFTDGDADRLAAWLGLGPTLPVEPHALRHDAERTLTRYLRALAQHAPVVVLLEDLHWADTASLDWLVRAGEALGTSRVLIVATARPVFLDEHPGWADPARGPHAPIVLPLRPLDGAATDTLVHALLAPVAAPLPAAVVELVGGTSEGNPYYAEELVAWLVEQGVVDGGASPWRVRTERLAAVAGRVPTTLRALLQARLDTLVPAERTTLERAAVVGRVFWDSAVEALGAPGGSPDDDGGSGPAGPGPLDALLDRGLVVEQEPSTFAGTRELAFHHALLRDVAYATLLREHRRTYHRRAADWLVRTAEASGRTDQHAALVARHLDRAGDVAASAWYVRAGRQAARVYALDEALTLLDRAVALADGPAAGLHALLARESVLDRRGDRAAQDVDLEALARLVAAEDARELAGDHGVVDRRARLDALLARVRRDHEASRYGAALSGARVVEERARTAGLPDVRAEAALWAGRALTWSVGGAEASSELDRAYDLALAAGLPAVAGEALRHLGILAEDGGRYAEAYDLAARARRLFEEAGDADGEAAALFQLGAVASALGRADEARTALDGALRTFDRSGHRYRAAVARNALAELVIELGALDVADALLDDALATMQDVEDREGVAVTLLVRTRVDVDLGRLADAAAHATEALGIATDVRSDLQRCDAHYRLSVVARLGGDAPSAVRHAQDAVDAGARAPGTNEEATAWLWLGHARLAAGDAPGAVEAFGGAAARLAALDGAGRVHESEAGLARALVAAGREDDGAAAAEPLVVSLLAGLPREGGVLDGAESPATALACVVGVLEAVGDPRLETLRDAVAAWVVARAEQIGDPELRARFLAAPPQAGLVGRGGPADG